MTDEKSTPAPVPPEEQDLIGKEIFPAFVIGFCLSILYVFEIQGKFVSWSRAEEHIYLFKFPLSAMLLEGLVLTLVGHLFCRKNVNGIFVPLPGSKKWIRAFAFFMAANMSLIFGWLSGYMVTKGVGNQRGPVTKGV